MNYSVLAIWAVLAVRKKVDLSFSEQLLRVVFSIFCGQKEKKIPFQVFPYLFQIRTPFNYLLMNLIIAESLITMYGLPVDFTATYYFGWKMGENLCKATGFILTTSGKNCILLPELFGCLLKFEAGCRAFAKFLRPLEQFI